MFDFEEELKKFEPSTDVNLTAVELSGEEAADMQTLLRMIVQDAERPARNQFDQLGLEDVR